MTEVSTGAPERFGIRAGGLLRIGYLPLLDAAPLVVAHELGFFAREGLATTLCRQPGWACVRDKMLYGALDVAHAPAGFLYAINAGATSNVGRCLTAFVMSAQGNAITLSNRLHERGLRSIEDLPAEVRARRSQLITLGIVSQHSSHAHLLRGWLARGGLDPDTHLRIVVLPPQQMVASLASGHLDGFCAGEPWNSLAVEAGEGWVVAGSAELAPMHPEKIVLVHEDFALRHHEEHMRLLRAQQAACDWCADPANRQALVKCLARWVFFDIPEKLLLSAFSSALAPIFAAPDLHVPSHDKARWVLDEMRRHKLLPGNVPDSELLASFRQDLYESIGVRESALHDVGAALAAREPQAAARARKP